MDNADHDDVVKLRTVLEVKWAERDREKRKAALAKELDVDEDVPTNIFFCSKCVCDFRPRRAWKGEDEDWNTGGKFRYWKARHVCGTWSKRFISDKLKDPFWKLSPSVKRERAMFKRDILQPHETGFNMLYQRINEQKQKQEILE